jgi:hypothetical protein
VDGEYVQLERRTGGSYWDPTYTFWYNGTQYTGQRYTRQAANQSRLEATQEAVNTLASSLLANNGKDGNPGVYIGSGDMPEGYNVQIDPNGSSDPIADAIAADVWTRVEADLEEAKASGVFDGEDGQDGHTPVKGTDYFTEADKTEIATQAAGLVDTSGKLDKSGGTLTGRLTAQSNTSYTTKQVRNIALMAEGASTPSTANGDVILTYTP